MFDLGSLSLADLRDVAKKLEVAGAGDLSRTELEGRLAPRLAEVVQVVQVGKGSEGRVAFAGEHAPATFLASSPGGAQSSPITSGSGPTAPVPLEPPKVPIADLPWAYDDDRLVLLVRDPRTLFCYWDFHPKTVAAAKSGWSDAWAKLRLVALGRAEPEPVRELDVDLGWKSYYLYDCEPNRDYRVEVLLRGPNGEERLVGRASNVATLPPNQPSAWVEDRFLTLPLDVRLPIGPGGSIRGSESDRRLHARAFELSGGEAFQTGDEASSSRSTVQGFGGRGWSGTLVRGQ